MSTNLSAITAAKVRAQLGGIPQQPAVETVDQAQDAVDQPIPFLLTEAAEQLPRKVTVSVRGQKATIDCPAWCVDPHSEDYAFIQDVSHHGEEIALTAPEHQGTTEVLVASISQWPFVNDEEQGLPYLGFDATGSGDVAALAPAAALAFIDQAAAHLDKLRAQVRQLAEARQS
ncbi:DUF6907 domain-containing protein [Streptomyces asiaticus]|uniref:DUF6907 domain-containing protein n=1 Tax=Streptomyces asiaticus TaxID=114695 RepID=UPI0038216AEC